MENFDFDNKFKEGFDNIYPGLDNDEIWENIEPHLKKKKKRRFLIWFFFGAIGVLILLWPQSDGAKIVETSTSSESIVQVTPEPIVADLPKEDIIQPNNESGIEETQLDKNKMLIVKKDNDVIQIPSREIIPQKQIIEKRNEEVEAPEKVKAEEQNSPTTSTINPLLQKSSLEKEEDIISIEQTSQKEISPTPKIEVDAQQEDIIENTSKEKIFKTPKPNSSELNVTKKLTKKERREANEKRKKERKKEKEERAKKKKEAKKKDDQKKNELTKPNKLPKWKYNFQVLGSGMYTFHTLKDQNSSETAYLRNRNKYVKGTEGFGTDIRFTAESPRGLIIVAGIQYQQLHEKLQRVETLVESEVKEVLETVIEDGNGQIINSTSTMQLVTTTTTYNQQLYNQYRFINFPVGVGYAFKARKMRLKLLGGVHFNAYSRFSGSFFTRDLSIIRFTSRRIYNYDRIFKNTTGIGAWASIQWHKPVNERFSLLLGSGIQTPIGSISRNNEFWPISHKLLSVKLEVGINYQIGKINKPKKRSRNG